MHAIANFSLQTTEQKNLMAYTTWPGFAYSFNLPLYLSLPHSLCFSHMDSSVFRTQPAFPQFWAFTEYCSRFFNWVLNLSLRSKVRYARGRPPMTTLTKGATPPYPIIQCHRTLFTLFKALLTVWNYYLL